MEEMEKKATSNRYWKGFATISALGYEVLAHFCLYIGLKLNNLISDQSGRLQVVHKLGNSG
jgi:hypothetical protein